MHVVSYMVSSSGVRNVNVLNTTKRQTNLIKQRWRTRTKSEFIRKNVFVFRQKSKIALIH
jgi:hypothetical protein